MTRRALAVVVAFASLHLAAAAALADAPTASSPPPGVSPTWLEAVRRDIAAREYAFSPQEDGAFSAPNRAKDLRSRVGGNGVSVVSRTRGDAAFQVELSLARAGREGALADVPAGAVELRGERVEIRREGLPFVEWYQNDPRGLEQGWTVETAPAGARTRALVLELAARGGLRPVARPADGRIALVDAAGAPQLLYGELVANDATGKTLGAALSVVDGRIHIRVDDRDAQYPIVIDPLIQPAAWSFENNVANANVGFSVATAGDVNADGYSDVIIGATGDANTRGNAYLFLGGPGGLSTSFAWSAQGAAVNDLFGYAVAAAGDVNADGFGDVVVGAPGNSASASDGTATVFYGSSQAPYLNTSTTVQAQSCFNNYDPFTDFGSSVSTAGDIDADGVDDVVIGAPGLHIDLNRIGYVCILRGQAGVGVNPAQRYVISAQVTGNLVDSHSFGASVSTAGDVNGDGIPDLLVGAPGAHIQGLAGAVGAVYVFRGQAGTAPAVPALWQQSGDDESDAQDSGTPGGFGSVVANAGDLNGDGFADIIVGAAADDSAGTNAGAVFVFHGASGGIATPATDCDPSNFFTTVPAQYCEFGTGAGAKLGYSVATAGDLNGDGYADAVIGMPGVTNALGGTGAVELLYGRSDGTYLLAVAEQILTSEVTSSIGSLGTAVATAGDTNGNGFSEIVVGTWLHANGQTGEGMAALFSGSGNPPQTSTLWNPGLGGRSADALATADVNGDGRADVIMGAPLFDAGFTDSGAIFVFNTPFSLGGTPTVNSIYFGTAASAEFGRSVANAGDVNNDGFEDVVVGSPGNSRAYVLRGSSTGLPAQLTQGQEIVGVAGTRFGQSVGAADVNGDGMSDVVVGAPLDETSGALADEGIVRAFYGNGTSVTAFTSWSVSSGQAGAQLGGVVSGVGDVNRDGFGDVLISAPFFSTTIGSFNLVVGQVTLFPGGGGGLSTTPLWSATGGGSLTNHDELGGDLGVVGDFNGDGATDFWVRSVLIRGLGITNRVLVYRGQPGGAPALQVALPGLTAAGGDVNGDGLSDVVVGNFGTLNASVFAGPLSSTTAIWSVTGAADSEFGARVATGDVNGDGVSDVLVGAPGFDTPSTDAGRVSLYLGNLGIYDDGRALVPAQNENTPPGCFFCLVRNVAVGGRATSNPLRVWVSAISRSPAGSALQRMQWEVKPLGTSFDGSNVTTGGPVATTGNGWFFTTDYLSLATSTPQHWRVRFTSPNPFFPRTRWISMAENAPNESDIRGQGAPLPDQDGDGVVDTYDNCPTTPNTNQADGDADGRGDVCDNCPVTANANQADVDGDLVGDVCDNCSAVANPRVAADYLTTNPWATLTGGQRDDDHDGYGNRCDAKFPGVSGALVGSNDLSQLRVSNGRNRTGDTCGTTGTRPCAIFDLDEAGTLIGSGDLALFRTLNGKAPGPKCATCPLTCAAGANGTCSTIP